MPVQRKTGRRPPPSWTTLLGVLVGLLAVAAPVVWLLAGSGHTGEADPAEVASGFAGPAPDPTMPAVDAAAGPPTAPVTTTTAPVPDPTAPEPTAGTPSSATATTVSDPTGPPRAHGRHPLCRRTPTRLAFHGAGHDHHGARSRPDRHPPRAYAAASSLPADTHPAPSTIAATGDLIIHKAVARTARTADGWDFTPMFSQVRDILRAADLAVCHLACGAARGSDRGRVPRLRAG